MCLSGCSAPTSPASGQLSTFHSASQADWGWEMEALMLSTPVSLWWLWKASQLVHLPWLHSLYFREWSFQERHCKQPQLFTQGEWHFFFLWGTSACLVTFCHWHCSCWWMCGDRKYILGIQVLWLVLFIVQLVGPKDATYDRGVGRLGGEREMELWRQLS